MGKILLERLVYGLYPVVQIAYERLGFEDAVDEPVAVAVAERADAGIQHAVNGTQVHGDDLGLVLVQLAERAGRETDLRAVLHERKEQIALRRALDAPFGGGREDAAAAHPSLVVVFLEGKNPDARIVRLNIGVVRVLEAPERAARLDHLLVEPLDLAL